MTVRNGVKSIDANILLDYVLQNLLKDPDKKKRVNKFFNPSNSGEFEIRIFVYTMGEVFKRLLGPRNGEYVNLMDTAIQRHFQNVRTWMKEGHLVPVKMDSLSPGFQQYYNEIDRNDSIIQKGDKLALAAFCSDDASTSFYSFDRDVNQSVWLQEYVGKLGKRIQEP
jgi:hypothetical protein